MTIHPGSFGPEDGAFVTQAELTEFAQLRQQKKELERRISELQDAIRRKLENDFGIEPGSLSAELKQWEQYSFSYQKIANVIGDAEASELKCQIEPTTVTRIFVKHSTWTEW